MKYNSNSGFVDNTTCRQTPQAFSHFTFERSGHELIVVDVQGVGDLYTDPQIHTADGKLFIESSSKTIKKKCSYKVKECRNYIILFLK